MAQALTANALELPASDASAPVNKWGLAVAVALGALLEVVDTSIVNVALTEIQTALGATLSEVSWVVSSYAVANVIILPLTAWLGMRFGKKRYFIFSLVAFILASMLCGVATSLPMLIVARVLQGLGGGGLLAKAQAYLFETFPKEEQAMAQGFFGAIVIAGPAIGPTLGGYLVTNVDWRWIFFINLPIGVVAIGMCMVFLPSAKPQEDKQGGIDWAAILLLAVGLGCLQTALEEGQSDDWFDSSFIISLFIGAALGLSLFVWRQLKSSRPVVDLRVLRHRSLWAGSLLSVVVGMALYGALFSIPIFAQTVLQYTAQDVGILLLPGALSSALMMPIAARLLGRFDARLVLVCGTGVLISALMSLAQLSPSTGSGDLFWPLIIRAVGTTLMFLPLNMATLGPIPKEDVGTAAGFFSLTRQLGGSIGVALLTTLLAQRMAFHRATLVEHLGASDPAVLTRVQAMTQGFMSKGMDANTAHLAALEALDGMVSVQSAVLSFNDTFWATAALIIATLPLVLLLGKSASKKIEMGH